MSVDLLEQREFCCTKVGRYDHVCVIVYSSSISGKTSYFSATFVISDHVAMVFNKG